MGRCLKKIIFINFLVYFMLLVLVTCSNKNNNITIKEENNSVSDVILPGLDEIGNNKYSLPIDLMYDGFFYSSKEGFYHFIFTDKQINELNYILQKYSWDIPDNPESLNFDDLESYGLVYQNIIVAYFNKSGSKMLIRINNIYDGSITAYYFVPIEIYNDIEKYILKLK